MNSENNVLQEEKNVSQKFVVKYKINDRGEKIYENIEKMVDEEKLSKYMDEQTSKNDPKALQYEIF